MFCGTQAWFPKSSARWSAIQTSWAEEIRETLGGPWEQKGGFQKGDDREVRGDFRARSMAAYPECILWHVSQCSIKKRIYVWLNLESTGWNR
jgi:hypothetical protein